VHNRELEHVIKGLQYLNGESFGQSHRKSLEIIIFDELVQVNTQHFEADEHVTAEGERVFYPHNIFGILMVLLLERLQNLDLNFTLLVQFLPVFQYL